MHPHPRLIAAAGAATLLAAAFVPPATAGGSHGSGGHGSPGSASRGSGPALRAIATLEGARGVDALGGGRTLVTEADGSFSLVIEGRRGRPARVRELGRVPAGGLPPAIAAGRSGVYLLTAAGAPGTGAASLYRWRPGWSAPRLVRDIAAYQAGDPDPYNVEGTPDESNPFGLAVLPDGSAVVADAANNDVLRVTARGRITTLARIKPRTVTVPEGLPATDPDGEPLPPAGTPIPAEAVATSVAVDRRGNVYVGELRGFPATPGTSQIWRIRAGASGVTCDPAPPPSRKRPARKACTVHADGLTSIVGLAVDARARVWATSLSTKSWLQWELGVEGAEVGGLFRVERRRSGRTRVRELFAGRIPLPGDVDAAGRNVYLVAPSFGPSTLWKVTTR